jgi:hypothetical protein
MFEEFDGGALSEAEQETAGALAVVADGLEHLLFEFRSHARQAAQFLFTAEALEFVDGADAEVFPDEGDALGAESLNLEEFEGAGREAGQQFIAFVERTALENGQPIAPPIPLPMPGTSVILRSGLAQMSAMRSG